MAPISAHRATASFALPPASQPLALITGDAGDNVLTGTSAGDSIDGLGGNDRIDGLEGRDTVSGGAGNDLINDFLDNVVDGGDGDDLIVNYFVSGGTWSGGAGRDTIDFSNDAFDASINLSAASFLILGATFSNFESVIGSQGNEAITGTSGANALDGQGGNDTLIGGAGFDTLNGGTGNDTLSDSGGNIVNGGDGDDTILASAVTGGVWSGGNGNDTINFWGNSFAPVTIDLSAASFIVNTAGFRGFENIIASAGNETILGTSAGNRLDGAAGDDNLSGGGGNDVLIGGIGTDKMTGDVGDDIYFIDAYYDETVELAGGGRDIVYSTISRTLAANVEVLVLQGAATLGNGNVLANEIYGNALDNALRGYDGNDTLYGAAGNDILYGDAGSDVMLGGLGDDVYYADSGDDRTVEYAGQGRDTVLSTVGGALTDNVESLRLMGAANVGGVGNTLDNLIAGNAGDNALYARAGNDTLEGGAGNDVLYGDIGNDLMTGGAGNDTYSVDTIGDQTIELAGEGIDTVKSFISLTLAANIENLTLQLIDYNRYAVAGTGNELANNIVGNDGDNVLSGLGGDDTLSGGFGNDELIGGLGNDTYNINVVLDSSFRTSIVTEQAGGGVDTIISSIPYIYSELRYDLAANVENLRLTGSAAYGQGNDLNNAMWLSTIEGELRGLGGDDTLTGSQSYDRLDGGVGADLMIGGLGDDVYLVDSIADQITELAGGGTDTVIAQADITLSAHVENLTLSGANAIGRGNDLANLIVATGNGSRVAGLGGNDNIVLMHQSGASITAEGGLGRDAISLSGSNFTIAYGAVAESTGANYDIVQGLLLDGRGHVFDFPTLPTRIASTITRGALNEATFDADLSAAVGAAQMGAGEAVLFRASAGDQSSVGQFLIVDANGVAGYQAGADYVVALRVGSGTLSLDDFI